MHALIEYSLMAQEASPFGGKCTIGQVTGPCSLSTIGFGGRFVAGGISANAEVTAVVRKSIFAGPFQTGDNVSIADGNGGSRKLKISSEGIRDGIYFWELTCNDPAQGA